ncbi:hypothetical protein J6590_094028 [Homalodisca vitripennis]|nr:hypothetical protein J6590_017381 [Homalodisca vitripennis]KAG8309103.1 hypothetical protein J6590_094028 [Homalodisca vitripennis]
MVLDFCLQINMHTYHKTKLLHDWSAKTLWFMSGETMAQANLCSFVLKACPLVQDRTCMEVTCLKSDVTLVEGEIELNSTFTLNELFLP